MLLLLYCQSIVCPSTYESCLCSHTHMRMAKQRRNHLLSGPAELCVPCMKA